MKNKASIDKKQEIIDKALSLFLDKGYHGLSVASLARETKIAKGLLYYYFDSKEALLGDVIAHLCDVHVRNFNERFQNQDLNFYEKFMMILDAYHEIHPDNTSSVDTAWLSLNSFVELFHKGFLEKIDDHITALARQAASQSIFAEKEAKLLLIMLLEGITGLARLQTIDRKTVIDLLEKRFDLEKDTLRESGNRLLTHF